MRNRLIVAGAGAVAVTVLFWFVLLSPKLGSIDEVRTQLQSARQDEQTLRNRIDQLKAARKNAPAARARLAALALMLPTGPDLPNFIRQMQDASEAAGVDLATIAPGAPTETQAGSGVQTITVTVGFTGPFRRVADFIARLENLQRVLQINSLSLSSSGSEGGTTTLQGTVNMVMYVVAANAAVSTPPAPSASP